MKILIKNINKEFDFSGLSPDAILDQADIPEKQKFLAARFNGKLTDWNQAVDSDGTLEFLDFSSPEARDIFRHTSSHIMAQAVQRLFPGTKLGIGPAIEDGFYYDFDFKDPVQESDLGKIEDEIKKIIKEDLPVVRRVVSKQEAVKLFKEKDEPYKTELISELNDAQITVYSQGEFIDLCKGPHLTRTGKVKVVKLLRMSGAYWRGNEKNKMLQRIYGVSFETRQELDEYMKRVEEALKRDHTRLGKELDLYVLNPAIGKGLPLFTPKGTIIKMTLQRWVEDEEMKRGYQFTSTPVLAKTELYKISGHIDHYRDKMFIFKTDENEELALRPMTCPYHFMIYKSKLRSYRELPIRYAETSVLFRKELSGELHGLIRIWQFTLADAHIICMPEQLEAEFENALHLVQ
ncbi:MAG: threonine--tRNA ligase, partial [bacterium]|nr:threonine--tRNA ligase [bacterium]